MNRGYIFVLFQSCKKALRSRELDLAPSAEAAGMSTPIDAAEGNIRPQETMAVNCTDLGHSRKAQYQGQLLGHLVRQRL
jgi:hypothetical protein